METIFVQIASYRDSELLPTIKHCLERAKHPERLRFGIVWQKDEDDKCLEEFKNDPRFKIMEVHYKNSKGACWARYNGQKLYNNETYTVQLDSHIRFIKEWDEHIINIWKSLDDPKAVITGYPPNYNPTMKEEEWYNVPQICNIYRFNHSLPESRPANMPDWEKKTKPVRGIHISAGFIFGPGEINKTVPYDPDFYFSGEECAMALRYFTHGYNLYNSHKVIVYHFYQRLEHKKHWSDHGDWGKYNDIAHKRLDCLLGRNKDYDLGEFGLGKERTIEDFRVYAGMDYDKKIVHKDMANGVEPPCNNSEEGWDNEIVNYKETLTWDYDKIEKMDDPRFWAMIILDQDGIAIHREDWPYNEKKDYLDGKIRQWTFSFDRSKNRQIPTQLLIWPYSESKQWIAGSYQPIQIVK